MIHFGAMITMCADDAISQLLRELSDAKTWPESFKGALDSGSDVAHEIREADKKIEALEKQAKEAMKRFGCINPHTRTIYHAMADMLISWTTFKDSLRG